MLVSTNPFVQEAVEQFTLVESFPGDLPKELRDQLAWTPPFISGAILFSFLGMSLARLYSKVAPDIVSAVYFAILSGMAVYGAMGIFAPAYVEALVEGFIGLDYLILHLLFAGVVMLVTEVAYKHI